ncbi:MAG: hypothetical protein IJT38_05580 [Clostridia bacterium]|nr:hypothetical protein [Clostridia bacterium]
MSVPEGQRSKGKLAIETETEKLLQYIFDVTTKYYLPPEKSDNEKVMRDKITEFANARWLADHMRSEILSCLANIQTANKIKIEDNISFYERRKYQAQAERAVENVLTSATLMYSRKLIKSKRVKYIGIQIGHIKAMIQNWRKSDKSRYTKTNKN